MRKMSFQIDLDDVATSDVEGVGTVRESGGKRFMWCLFSAGADTPAKGDACGYVAASYTGTTVTTDESAAITGVLAGCIQNETNTDVPADGEYFWMQIGGQVTLSTTVEDSGAAGDAICLGGGDGACGVAGAGEFISGFLFAALVANLNCPSFTGAAYLD